MTDLDEGVVQTVNDLGTRIWSGTAYRSATSGRDPMSGAGARLMGGRWNPKGLFSTIYLAQPLATCAGEFDRTSEASGIDPMVRLRAAYELHTFECVDLELLDLRSEDDLQYVGLTLDDISDDDKTACQAVGHAAWFLEMDGVVAPSATGAGLVIALFENRLTPGQVRVTNSVPFDESAYARAKLVTS